MVKVIIKNLVNNKMRSKLFLTNDEALFWLTFNSTPDTEARIERFSKKNYKTIFTSWEILRYQRDIKLKETDYTQLADVDLTSEEKKEYREYRKYLRDLPSYYDERTSKTAEVLNLEEWKRIWKRY